MASSVAIVDQSYCFPISGNFVYIADPNTIEDVLRAEGKYPTRVQNMDDRVAWFFTHLGYKVPLTFS